jgi:hypothetical protein
MSRRASGLTASTFRLVRIPSGAPLRYKTANVWACVFAARNNLFQGRSIPDNPDRPIVHLNPIHDRAGKLEARREDCAPAAGKSTLNRLEPSTLEATRYHKISHNPVAIKNLMVDLFLEARERPPKQIILALDAADDPLHGEQEGRFFHGYYDCYCYLPLYVFCGRHLLVAKLRRADMDAAAGAIEEVEAPARPTSGCPCPAWRSDRDSQGAES